MTYKGAIKQLYEMRDNIWMPEFFKPYFDKIIETLTDDVRENAKGEWLPHPNKDFREWDVCSACGVGCKRREYELGIAGMEYMTEYNYPYCPNCGADMRGEQNE